MVSKKVNKKLPQKATKNEIVRLQTCEACEKNYKTQKGLSNHKCKPIIKATVTDITTFFTTSSRNENDAANKTREKVLTVISNPPREFLEDTQHGNSWLIVKTGWSPILSQI